MEIKLYHYIVELEPGVWLADWPGDPGRTLVKDDANGRLTRHEQIKENKMVGHNWNQRKEANMDDARLEEIIRRKCDICRRGGASFDTSLLLRVCYACRRKSTSEDKYCSSAA